jgi:hypothetical protein
MPKKLGNVEENINVIAKKRGRKSKKEIEEASKNTLHSNDNIVENIVVKIEEKEPHEQQNMSCNNEIIDSDNLVEHGNTQENLDYHENNNGNENNICQELASDKPVAKKRGRKPKGGKIIQQIIPLSNLKENRPNVILHLKCSLKDLNATNLFGFNLEGYSFSNSNNYCFDSLNNNENNTLNDIISDPSKLSDYDTEIDSNDYEIEPSVKNKENSDIREVWKKLKVLEHNLHINNIDNKKSACFWDTCEFDNPPVYIPKHFINNTYQVYGCFCSPECAVAHLMEENIDSSIKFERYQLMNHIYSKVYNYNKNIKPAPNPFYMLEKYYGNLSIQEFRSLLRNERLFLVVDKPLTRIMPELHEDNDDFIINNKIIPTNNIKLRKFQKKQTKTNILSERFGLAQI